jgi:nitroimidazol reductase NimA-like FMN-containing flavoprotein (pyridoxamine 5'-phosphate oxidase superfamily)
MVVDGVEPLSELECQSLLAGARVGRVSVSVRALPVIVPVSYRYLGDNVVLSMSDGPAYSAIASGNVIALGVDSANLADAFWSVLVVGRAAEVNEPAEHAEFRTLGLGALTGMERSRYVRLLPEIVTGYRAST